MGSRNKINKQKIKESISRWLVLLFQDHTNAYLIATEREEANHKKGFWVYYESYADFKKKQHKAKILGLTGLSIVAVVIVSLVANIFFPAIFKSEASDFASWSQENYEDFIQGKSDENIDIESASGEIRLKANRENRIISDKTFFQSAYTPIKYADQQASIFGINNDFEIALSKTYSYNSETPLALSSSEVHNVWSDKESGLMYVSTNGGLNVIDTKKTINSSDDEILGVFSANSNILLPSNYVYHSVLDKKNNLLFVSNWGGLSIVDTKGTETLDDDQLITTYNTQSRIKLEYNKVQYTDLDEKNYLLYVCTNGGGLTVIDYKGTRDTRDDEIIGSYAENGNIKIGSNRIYHSFLDDDGYLYISTFGAGLYIIDTKKTKNISDDVVVANYSADTLLSIGSEKVNSSFLDEKNQVLLISTNGAGLKAIEIKKGNIFSDKMLYTYDDKSKIDIDTNDVVQTFIDSHGMLYIGVNGGGLVQIDTMENIAQDDDIFISKYNDKSKSPLPSNGLTSLVVDEDKNVIYLTFENSGISIISNDLINNAVVLTEPIDVENIGHETISWFGLFDKEDITIQTRTGGEKSYQINNMDNDRGIEVKDIWGSNFSKVNFEKSQLILSGREEGKENAAWQINLSNIDDFYPQGSVVRVKIKIDTLNPNVKGVIFTDEWEKESVYFKKQEEWQIVKIIPSQPFSSIGFSLVNLKNFTEGDFIAIDYISIESANENWSTWSEELINATTSALNISENNKWVQLKINIKKNKISSDSPRLEKVVFNSKYQTSGEYLSPVIDVGCVSSWKDFSVDSILDAGTSYSIYTRSGANPDTDSFWSLWENLDDNTIVSPPDRYLQYKVILKSDDNQKTPRIQKISIKYFDEVKEDKKANIK